MEKMQQVIEQKVRPALKAHNGDIELVEVTSDGLVKVRFTGACAACPGAQQTLAELVETAIKEACPEVKGVVLLQQVSEQLIEQALKILRKEKT
ncbi:NifU family protein [Sporomusa aerivorans]|uniref:NifU family protein n=1 Tax=Sporomusa aerivorans TaxID=204936 RepID=UPI00352ACDDA